MGDYKLSAQLLGHEADVRALAFPDPDLVLSASRDCTVRAWRRKQASPPDFESSLVSRGSEYVNSVAFYPPTKDHPDGLVVSGGKDTIVEVKSPKLTSSDNAERLLIGHAHNVCTLDVSPGGTYLVSGGWDGQARVWNLSKWETELMLDGHEGKAVWNVLAYDEQTVITGCADKSIRIFDLTQGVAGEVSPKATIYTPDVVRALCRIPSGHPSGAEIASASNDGTIRLWKLNGQQVAELPGHDSFVYSMTTLPSGELVSAGEDRTVRIWRGTECVQTITHPAISVWTVVVNKETGDIVTGASDSVARVFTRRQEAFADAQTLKEFQDAVQQSAIPQQQMPGINKEKLPGPEFLQNKVGTKEGQVQMIKEDNGNITAHTWSMSQQQWVNVGTVVNSAGSSGKKVDYQGQSFDFVFDVDIEEGKPPLKLPYNLSENPYDRATKFLNDNELPLSYLDQVANFITQNTQGATLGQQEQGGDDPYGTESRYRPGEESQSKTLPQTEYLSITAAKYEAMFNKILSINQNMVSTGNKDAAFNPSEQGALAALRQNLEASKPPAPQAMELVLRMLTKWPYSDRLPGLDLLRCIVKFPKVASYSDDQHGSVMDIAILASLPKDATPNENAVMMAARAVANAFSTADGRSVALDQADRVLAFLEQVSGVRGEGIGKLNRNVNIAVTTALLNYGVLVQKERVLTPENKRRLAVILIAIVKGQTDSEVLYRGLIGLGTLLSASNLEAKGLGAAAVIQGVREKASEERVKSVATECMRVAPS